MQIRITTAGFKGHKYELLGDDGTVLTTRHSHRDYSACAAVTLSSGTLLVTWHSTPERAAQELQTRMSGYERNNAWARAHGEKVYNPDPKGQVVLAAPEVVADARLLVKARAEAKVAPKDVLEAMRSACWGATAGIREGKVAEAEAVAEQLEGQAVALRGPKQRNVAAYYAGIVRKELAKAARA